MKKSFYIFALCSLPLAGCASVNHALQPFSQDVLNQDMKKSKNHTQNNDYVQQQQRPVIKEEPKELKEPKKHFGLGSVKLNKLNVFKHKDNKGDNDNNTSASMTYNQPNYSQQQGSSISLQRPQSQPQTINPQNNYNNNSTETYAVGSYGNYEYRLGSSDRVRVIVFGEQDLSGEFFVTGDGKMSLPLIGEVNAKGLTITQLQDRIASKLAQGYLKNPRVSAEVLNYRPFYILGEVNKPGMYPYSSGLMIDNAVALSGGYTYRADKRKFYIKHENQSDEVSVPAGGMVLVQPGDTIRVGERYF